MFGLVVAGDAILIGLDVRLPALLAVGFAMYSLVPLLAVAAVRRARRVWPYIAIAVAGGAISTYHVLLERFPDVLETGTTCDPKNPCSLIWVERFG